MDHDDKDGRRTFTEEIEVAAKDLIARIDALIKEGNVRMLRIRSEKGDVFLELPLTIGAVGGGVVALAAPWLAVLGAITGLMARVKIEIVRVGEQEENKSPDGPDDTPGSGPDDRGPLV
jgi:hypothetical protein